MTSPIVNAVDPLSEQELEGLRQIRLGRGWSFRRLAEDIGLPESTVQNLLRGLIETPRDTTVYRVRQWLGAQAEVTE